MLLHARPGPSSVFFFCLFVFSSSDLWTCTNFQPLFTSFIGNDCSAESLPFLLMVAFRRPSLRGNSQVILARWDRSLGLTGENWKNVKKWNEIHVYVYGLNGTSAMRGLGLNLMGDQQSATG